MNKVNWTVVAIVSMIALLVLIACFVLWLTGGPPGDRTLALVGALALARLLP